MIALLMVGGVFRAFSPADAADVVCGDGAVDAPEQCDDGNLRGGDGCSSACTVEACGNAVIDTNEQCDDGNAQAGDGCNQFCQIEFCGDNITQTLIGEECDDGNGLSGDGCTSSCKSEEGSGSTPDPETNDPKNPDQGPETNTPNLPVVPTVPAVVIYQSQAGLNFLATPDGADYLSHLTREEVLQLETILKKLGSGRRLNAQERAWAETLYVRLQEAVGAERTRYTDLLKQFISTPISTEVVDEKELQKSNLVGVEVPVAISELQEAVAVIRRGELESRVTQNLAKLRRQGIDLTQEFPGDVEGKLQPDTRPIEVFATLKGLKEAAEKFATEDVPGSLDIIRTEARSLREALPVFQQEYGVNPEEIDPLLQAIDELSGEVTKQEVDRMVAAIERFISALERRDVVSQADFAGLDERATHAAATASRLIRETGRQNDAVTQSDIVALVSGLAEQAPEEARPAFERGDDIAQRVELLKFLGDEPRIHELRGILRKDGNTEFDFRYTELRQAIARVGSDNAPDTPCDDSMQDALLCTNEYLSELQDAARNRNFMSRLIGKLQDYFGIGS